MANKYRLGRKIGSGSFGDIYLGAFPLGVGAGGLAYTPTIARAAGESWSGSEPEPKEG